MSHAFEPLNISYEDTGKFTKIVLDYVNGSKNLVDFYQHKVNIEGIKDAINERKKTFTNRHLLAEQLNIRYKKLDNIDSAKANIDALLDENTFTVCTAHQPNIFTGHLYFIYKILHTIKLAEALKKQLPQYNFVPFFFMGSEDADLEELNHVVIDGRKYVWQTKQKGAVGRMKIDDNLLKLVDEIAGRLSVEKYGEDIISLLKKCFQKNTSIEQATFLFVHHLFKSYGLLIFLPDNGAFKKEMLAVFEEDIFQNTSSKIVSKTSDKLSAKYKVQAHPREINLFYLADEIRNRLVQKDDGFIVQDTGIHFSKEELQIELKTYPERFSPNVILRGLFQEIALPNIAFIGGGGELAYWLELKDLFQHYKVPFPMLILRNSFLVIDKKFTSLLKKIKLSAPDLFKGEETLMNEIVNSRTPHRLQLDEEKFQIQQAFYSIKKLANEIDITLTQHAEALEMKSNKKLEALEKKMLRSEKRKYADIKNQLSKIFTTLFPGNGLQERTENFMLYYSWLGDDFIKILYENSLTLEQQFCILEEIDE